MGKVLEIIGWLIILGTLAALVLIVNRSPYLSVWTLLIWALPSIFSGLIIGAFGRMVSELIAARRLAERQNDLLNEIAHNTRQNRS